MTLHPTCRAAALVIALAATPSTPALGQSMFGPPLHVPSGNHPHEVAEGDLDGNGWVDLAVVNRHGVELFVYMNEGAGNLGVPIQIEADADARDVDIQKLDNDDLPDVAVLCCNPGGLRVFRSDGSGGLEPHTVLALAEGVQHLAMGDIDDDGDVDACVTRFYQHDLVVLRNDGTGQFSHTATYSLPGTGRDVALADLNGDRWPDLLATLGNGSSISVFLNDGQGGFGPRTDHLVGSTPRSIACADLDRDGNPDVAVGSDAGMAILLGDGAGGLSSPQYLSSAAWQGHAEEPEAVDLDGDGFVELVALSPDGQTFTGAVATVFSYEPGSGWENEGDFALGHDAGWGGIAAPDLNGDGFRELVVCGYHAGQLAVLQHAGTDCDGDGFYDPEAIDDGVVPDTDGDGIPDACDCGVVSYCYGQPNSVGPGGAMGWSGAPSLSENRFFLRASQLPPGQSALFFASDLALPTPVPFGDGVRCIGGSIVRLDPPLSIDASGQAVRQLDFRAPPANAYEVGETRHYQLWYRDPCAVCWGWNLTDALAVTFCP